VGIARVNERLALSNLAGAEGIKYEEIPAYTASNPSHPIHHNLCITNYASQPMHHNLCIIINRRRFRSWEIQLRRLALTSPFERRLLARGSECQGLR
jgi:hypothetical protein